MEATLYGHAKRASRVLLAALGVNVVVAVTAIAALVHDPAPWAPLYGYDDQTVENPYVEAADVTARVSVDVTAKKCAHEPVTVVGQSSWVSVEPAGRIVPIGQGVARREKGCTRLSYRNAVPGGVLVDTAELGGRVAWRLVGTENPVDGRRQGVPATWRTDPVIVVVVGPAGTGPL